MSWINIIGFNIENLAEKLEGYVPIMLVPATLLTGTIGAIVGLLLSGDEVISVIGLCVGMLLGFYVYISLAKYLMKINMGTHVASEVRGDELIERYNDYPRCGEYILTRFTDVYSAKYEDGLRLVIDMPGDDYEVYNEFPYNWDEESSGIVAVFNQRGLEIDDMEEIIGQPVLVKTKDGTTREFEYYNTNPPSDKIQWLYDDGDITRDNVDIRAIEQNFDVSLPWDTKEEGINEEISKNAIKSEGSVYDLVDSIR